MLLPPPLPSNSTTPNFASPAKPIILRRALEFDHKRISSDTVERTAPPRAFPASIPLPRSRDFYPPWCQLCQLHLGGARSDLRLERREVGVVIEHVDPFRALQEADHRVGDGGQQHLPA